MTNTAYAAGVSPRSDSSSGVYFVPRLTKPWPGGPQVSAVPGGMTRPQGPVLLLLVCGVNWSQKAGQALDLLLPGVSNNFVRPARAP